METILNIHNIDERHTSELRVERGEWSAEVAENLIQAMYANAKMVKMHGQKISNISK